MIAILGDLHFRSDKDYFIKVCESFLTWFRTWKVNSKENTLILAGDLVEQANPGGLTISFLEELANLSKFKEIHICVGNHDEKIINNISQLSYEFYSHKENIIIHRTVEEVEIEGKKVLILPYYVGLNEEGLSMSDFYSSIYKNKVFKNNYDLVVGHFAGEDASFPGSPDCVRNLDKLSGRICLGHIHTRNVDSQKYIGSVFAGKKNENDYTRAAWILDNSTWREERLPLLNEFLDVTYPDPLPESSAMVPIYTIFNCGSELLAKEKYGNIFIKKTFLATSETPNEKLELSRQFNSVRDMNIEELFESFVTSQKPPLPERVVQESKKTLNTFFSHAC